ncbi:Inorganic pyrophosphatase [Fulvia fulva]|uniref:Inorganic pyrophosphatase n=1 Tax=Passalora fulva TaxID=5499 RepID=A0A9Q8LDN3_PASFU|nr:Inorganic pyrophosphatase [Fulvia fulva]KAK4628953.1 Inorganic pyrophosphatase [Fulvia fulva]KAK4630251.1 Inorganic pyrophosphatase [Fulvia fulva]UJO14768.1 Inorganic pyrophosphatase [Fulvia fulva]WPV12052.1 Inorganic pyrophosphatase [Fulvia fulva]WPV27050.1 Inorganic pyrophosphatase [Fulvia fulva]
MLPLRLHTAASHAALRRARVSSPKAAWVSWETTPIVPASTQALHYLMAAVEDPGRRPTNYATKNLSATQRTGQLKHHLSASNNQLINIYTTNTTSEATPTMAQASLPTRGGYDPNAAQKFTARKIGAPHTLEHRVYIEKDGVPVSPFHDIPLYANEQQTVLNMVVEIPRWTNAKQEISKDEELNPIKQDTKKGKLRFVRNCFPHKGYLWNYGAFPQTWEDPNVTHPETKQKGDNDPLDVCEIGELVAKVGEVKQVKVLGVMALLDEGETDWKIIVIDVNDPLAPRLNDIEDVERHLPGLLRATNEWFRIYKIPDGKPENQFAFSGECKNRKYAMDIVRECAEAWEKLITGKTPKGEINLTNVSVPHSADRVDAKSLNVPAHEEKAPAPIDPSIDKWFYISGASA